MRIEGNTRSFSYGGVVAAPLLHNGAVGPDELACLAIPVILGVIVWITNRQAADPTSSDEDSEGVEPGSVSADEEAA